MITCMNSFSKARLVGGVTCSELSEAVVEISSVGTSILGACIRESM